MSDRLSDLSARIREGDHEALAEYVDLQTPKLQAFLNKRMSDRLKQKIEPDDLLQELTISCLKSLEEIELGDRDPFKWLCQQAERRIIDAHRRFFGASKREASREVSFDRAGSEQAGLGDLIAASITSASHAFSRQQKEFHLLAALESLPEDARMALKLRYLDGLPSKEIAERMGRSDGAVRVLLSRSVQRLQSILASNEEFQTLLFQQQPREDKNGS